MWDKRQILIRFFSAFIEIPNHLKGKTVKYKCHKGMEFSYYKNETLPDCHDCLYVLLIFYSTIQNYPHTHIDNIYCSKFILCLIFF